MEKLVKRLFELNQFELIYDFSLLNRAWIYEIEKIYAECFWNLGRVNEFYDRLQTTAENLITYKYYSKLAEFIEINNQRCSYRAFFFRLKIMYFAETNQEQKLLELLKDSHFGDTFEILSHYDFQTPSLARQVWNQKIQEQDRYEILSKELIEYLLLCEDDIQRMQIFEVKSLSEEQREVLLSIAKEKLNLSLPKIPKDYSLLRSSLKVERNIQIKQPTEETEFPAMYNLVEKINKVRIEKSKPYSPSDEEKRLITHFQFEQRSEVELNELINSFIGLGYFKLASELVKKLPLSGNKLYLNGFLSLKTGDYANCIYFLNEYLNQEEPQDPSPFLKLKLDAHKGLGNIDEIKRIEVKLQALGEDPN